MRGLSTAAAEGAFGEMTASEVGVWRTGNGKSNSRSLLDDKQKTGSGQRQELEGGKGIHPTHRKGRDGWGTRAFLAGSRRTGKVEMRGVRRGGVTGFQTT